MTSTGIERLLKIKFIIFFIPASNILSITYTWRQPVGCIIFPVSSLVSVSPEATGVGASPGFRGGVEHPALAAVQGDGGEVEVAGGVPVVLMARHT